MIELQVQGMTCGHCVAAVTRCVKAVDAQADVEVDLGTGRVRVDGGHAPAEAVAEAITRAGYPAARADATAPVAARKRSGGCCG